METKIFDHNFSVASSHQFWSLSLSFSPYKCQYFYLTKRSDGLVKPGHRREKRTPSAWNVNNRLSSKHSVKKQKKNCDAVKNENFIHFSFRIYHLLFADESWKFIAKVKNFPSSKFIKVYKVLAWQKYNSE